jgi:hypothetical protein
MRAATAQAEEETKTRIKIIAGEAHKIPNNLKCSILIPTLVRRSENSFKNRSLELNGREILGSHTEVLYEVFEKRSRISKERKWVLRKK